MKRRLRIEENGAQDILAGHRVARVGVEHEIASLDKNVPVYGAATRTPTLEDVYFAIERRIAEEEGVLATDGFTDGAPRPAPPLPPPGPAPATEAVAEHPPVPEVTP